MERRRIYTALTYYESTMDVSFWATWRGIFLPDEMTDKRGERGYIAYSFDGRSQVERDSKS